MPNYNHGKYIAQAIEAVVSQSRPPEEYIIIDDGSTDHSCAIIESYARQYSYITLLRNERNLGLLPAMDRLVELATGDYIYFGAADDNVLPGFFEKAMDLAGRHPRVGIVFGLMQFRDESGRVFFTQKLPATLSHLEESYLPPEQFLRDYLEQLANPLESMSPAAIFNKKGLQAVGGFQHELDAWCDTFAARALGLKHGACVMNRSAMVFLQDRSQTSVSGKWSSDPNKSLHGITRAAELMLAPEFRGYFPASYVTTFHSAYVDAILRDAMDRRLNHFDEMILWHLLPHKHRQRLINRIPRRIFRALLSAYMRCQSQVVKQRYCRTIARKATETRK